MKNKNRFNTILLFTAAMTFLSLIQSIITNESITFWSLIRFLVSGLISGFLFEWLGRRFVQSKLVMSVAKIETKPDEDIIFQTSANHFKGMEGVGGRLYLTNKRLVFQSHRLNIQNHQLSINLVDIDTVERYKNLGVLDNGLLIVTKESKKEKFVVEQPEAWVKQLT